MLGIFKKIFYLLKKRDKLIFVTVVLFTIFNALIEVLGVSLVIPLTEILLNQKTSLYSKFLEEIRILNYLNINFNIYILIYIIFFVFLFKLMLQIFFSFIKNSYTASVESNIAQRLFGYFVKSDYLNQIEKPSSLLVRSLSNEIRTFKSIIIFFIDIFAEIIIISSIIILLLISSPEITLVIFIFFLIISFIFFLFTKDFFYNLGKKRLKNLDQYIRFIIETFNAFRDIKIFKKNNTIIDNFKNLIEKYSYIDKIKNISAEITRYIFEFLSIVVICFVIFFSFKDNGDNSKIISSLALFTVAILRIVPSVNKLNLLLQSIKFNSKSVSNLYLELHNKEGTKDTANLKILKLFRNFEMNNILYIYKKNKNKTLSQFNLFFKKNDVIGIEGKSGAGKTTLINLIAGIIKPSEGVIKINSININKINLESWHNLIGYVGQNSYITSQTILENIIYPENKEIVNYKKINNLIKFLDLEDFIKSLPDGLNSYSGESGVKISGGQKQRLSITRALYRDPQLLILDEPTSSLDLVTASNVMNFINKMKKKITIIIVSHDIKYISKIIKFNKIIKIK